MEELCEKTYGSSNQQLFEATVITLVLFIFIILQKSIRAIQINNNNNNNKFHYSII
jgi:hypothetical protein